MTTAIRAGEERAERRCVWFHGSPGQMWNTKIIRSDRSVVDGRGHVEEVGWERSAGVYVYNLTRDEVAHPCAMVIGFMSHDQMHRASVMLEIVPDRLAPPIYFTIDPWIEEHDQGYASRSLFPIVRARR